MTTHICDDQQNLETPYKNVKMFPISSCKISFCKMNFIGIVSDCISRKIIRSTPNRKNLFGRKMKSSLNYLFIRLTDVIFRNKHHELQLLLKLENGDDWGRNIIGCFKDDWGRNIYNYITRSNRYSLWRAVLCCVSHGFPRQPFLVTQPIIITAVLQRAFTTAVVTRRPATTKATAGRSNGYSSAPEAVTLAVL